MPAGQRLPLAFQACAGSATAQPVRRPALRGRGRGRSVLAPDPTGGRRGGPSARTSRPEGAAHPRGPRTGAAPTGPRRPAGQRKEAVEDPRGHEGRAVQQDDAHRHEEPEGACREPDGEAQQQGQRDPDRRGDVVRREAVEVDDPVHAEEHGDAPRRGDDARRPERPSASRRAGCDELGQAYDQRRVAEADELLLDDELHDEAPPIRTSAARRRGVNVGVVRGRAVGLGTFSSPHEPGRVHGPGNTPEPRPASTAVRGQLRGSVRGSCRSAGRGLVRTDP